ncbi:hypothetical protein [Mycobacterium decipiens]|uniref:Mammalian cell entry protein n=1 Tax=Mycobacterium decipiens TaxID=1430326 RepID=A0A1X2LT37_9MYCO|nr:hypothetical protein [Mycobacterium decipiens]OSC39970.1 hypothetical protein B8W66_14990 [Mycobacterium decipiens]
MSSRESTSVAAAQDAAARAQERAEAARARATRLRKQAEVGVPTAGDGPARIVARLKPDRPAPQRAVPARIVARLKPDRPAPQRAVPARIVARLKHPGRKAVIVVAVTVFSLTSLVVSGLMLWQHHTIMNERQRAQEFAAAARHGVVILMSIDANHAKQDFQRIIDASTGQLKNQLEVTALALAEGVEQSKVSTKVTVDAVAVMSMARNSAVVLVAAKSERSSPDYTKQADPWRILVHLDRDGDQLKMSKVEFLP